MKTLKPLSADRVTITALVENCLEELVSDTAPVIKRFRSRTKPELPMAAWPTAEHGISLLIEVERAGKVHRALFDTGGTAQGAVHNARQIGCDLTQVELVALSHFHGDHTGGLPAVLDAVGHSVPVALHPDMLLVKGRKLDDGSVAELSHHPNYPERFFQSRGNPLHCITQPTLFFDDTLLTSGEIARVTSFEDAPDQDAFISRNGQWKPYPRMLDEQALCFLVQNKGLIILTGCAHAGVMNTVRHFQTVTGEKRVHLLLGGFHLGGPRFEPAMPETVDELIKLSPDWLVPCHCSGWKAFNKLYQALGDRVIHSSAGAQFEVTTA